MEIDFGFVDFKVVFEVLCEYVKNCFGFFVFGVCDEIYSYCFDWFFEEFVEEFSNIFFMMVIGLEIICYDLMNVGFWIECFDFMELIYCLEEIL